MLVDSRDPGISTDLLLDGIREPMMTEIMQREIHYGDVVVDIGANIGYYVLQESRLVGDKGRVFAIEPVQSNLKLLGQNLVLNRVKNTIAYRCAVGDRNGESQMGISSHRNLCSVNGNGKRGHIGYEKVSMTTLDDFMRDKPWPQMVRMDVEGYEVEVLRGMTRMLQSGKPLKMFIEVHFDILGPLRTLELMGTLRQAGFRVAGAVFEPHAALRHTKWASWVARGLERGMGATGKTALELKDLCRPEFTSGQVEYLEVLFER